jgi:hypothetical protein
VKREELKFVIWPFQGPSCNLEKCFPRWTAYKSVGIQRHSGENPVTDADARCFVIHFRRVELFGNAAQIGW